MPQAKAPADAREAGCERTADQMAQMLLEYTRVTQEMMIDLIHSGLPLEDWPRNIAMKFQGGAHCEYRSPKGMYCGFHDHHGETVNNKWYCRMHKDPIFHH